MLRGIFVAAAFWAALPTLSAANEIDGFRLGMTLEQALKVAGDRNYSFGKAMPNGTNWTNYVLTKDGPSLAFCGSVLSSVSRQTDSNLHEFTNTLERLIKSLGAPDGTNASQSFARGNPLSDLRYRWLRDNIEQSLSFFQWGTGNPQMSSGFSYINHPCRPAAR